MTYLWLIMELIMKSCDRVSNEREAGQSLVPNELQKIENVCLLLSR